MKKTTHHLSFVGVVALQSPDPNTEPHSAFSCSSSVRDIGKTDD
jgi:hypothetical protein